MASGPPVCSGFRSSGFVSGLLCVWLLIKENIWTFPLGLLYSVVTVVVMYNTQLYADVLLNFYYVLMNAYGWFFWIRGGQTRRSEVDELMVAWLPRPQWRSVVLISTSGIIAMGWYFDTFTNAAFAYADSFTTILSFVAMWMSARKYLDSWILWFIVFVLPEIMRFYDFSCSKYIFRATSIALSSGTNAPNSIQHIIEVAIHFILNILLFLITYLIN